MRVMITGVDGYLGWTLALHLAEKGYTVAGIDDYSRRRWVGEMGAQSAMPIAKMDERLAAFRRTFGKSLAFYKGDLCDYNFVLNVYKSFRPDAIVYLGQMPSAPYSMIDVHHAVYTQTNNVTGALVTLYAMRDVCPEAHLVKLGTMGEYGTPNVDIPEGMFDLEFRGRTERMIFPRKAGSWYHQSKVHDTYNVEIEEVYNVTDLANKVKVVGERIGMKVEVNPVENPRIEDEDNYYNPDHQHLLDLGYQPTHDMEAELELVLYDLIPHRERIESREDSLIPDIRWDGSRLQSKYLK